MWQRLLWALILVGSLLGASLPPAEGPRLQDIGGPDNFGHYWKDSKNACAASFFYLDPTSAGSMLAGEERSYVHIRLPFTVTFYGVDYDSIWITTEGFATFNTQGLLDWSNSEIPSTASSEPNNAFYVYWDDLDLRDYGRVDTGTFLVNGSRVFVIEWDSVEHYNYKGQGTFTFELQIYEAAPDSFRFRVPRHRRRHRRGRLREVGHRGHGEHRRHRRPAVLLQHTCDSRQHHDRVDPAPLLGGWT